MVSCLPSSLLTIHSTHNKLHSFLFIKSSSRTQLFSGSVNILPDFTPSDHTNHITNGGSSLLHSLNEQPRHSTRLNVIYKVRKINYIHAHSLIYCSKLGSSGKIKLVFIYKFKERHPRYIYIYIYIYIFSVLTLFKDSLLFH